MAEPNTHEEDEVSKQLLFEEIQSDRTDVVLVTLARTTKEGLPKLLLDKEALREAINGEDEGAQRCGPAELQGLCECQLRTSGQRGGLTGMRSTRK